MPIDPADVSTLPEQDEPSIPAEDPPQMVTWPQLFGNNYRDIVDELLRGTPATGGGTYNKHDAQVLRVKAAEIAERLTYRMTAGETQ